MSGPTETTGGGRLLSVDVLARVEGEGAMRVRIEGERVADVSLRIFEPPRLFEGFLEGRHYSEAPDLTARICGICPVAYQTSSCQAMEAACGVELDGPIRALRRLLYCAEWIESHALHVFMLHAPDFLGYDGAVEMAADHPELVERGLGLKKTGNDLMTVVGGRAVHPVNVCVGGFYRAPERRELDAFVDRLERGREASLETVRWLAGLDYPALERDYELVALSHPEEYAIDRGRLASSSGLDAPVADFEHHVEEVHVARSNALHGLLRDGRGGRVDRDGTGGRPYLVGPLARFALNRDRLSPMARQAADEAGLEAPCRNPFRSILVRAVELLYAFDEALRLVATYERPERPRVPVEPPVETRSGDGTVVGHGASEAPRGVLYHRYRIDGSGTIREARIIPPTAQNQPSIEEDLRQVAAAHLHLPDDELTWRCEQAIRNYDPCISCATHFLRLELERT